jgi:hypothetical protein
MSDIDRVMRKIQKCLALSASSNQHEAAAALRQAKALMDMHQVTMEDIELSRIDVEEVGQGRSRPPQWKANLYSVVARAFGCSQFLRGGRPVFVGATPGPAVAKYALEVLLRQLQTNKRDFMAAIAIERPWLDRSVKVRLGKGYAEGWVHGCYRVVEQFSAALSPGAREQHRERLCQHLQIEKIHVSAPRKSALDDQVGLIAGRSGFLDGQQAKIHAGMTTAGGPALLENE